MAAKKTDLLQGTLDLIVLKLLRAGPANGWDLTQSIQTVSRGALDVNYGSLYPALRRLEARASSKGKWGTSENNRRARFYELTAAGRSQLAAERQDWERFSAALGADPRRRLGVCYVADVRLRALVRRRRADAELDEELRYHLERETERNVARMSPRDASDAARRAFGNITVATERHAMRGAGVARGVAAGRRIRPTYVPPRAALRGDGRRDDRVGPRIARRGVHALRHVRPSSGPVRDPYSLYEARWQLARWSARRFTWPEFRTLRRDATSSPRRSRTLDHGRGFAVRPRPGSS